MMSLREWLASWRRGAPVTAAEIRREIAAVEVQHANTVAERQAIALDAVNDAAAARRFQDLDTSATELSRRVQMLVAALPVADEREAEAARQSDAAAWAARAKAFDQQLADAAAWVEPIVARLVTVEELQRARDWRDLVSHEGRLIAQHRHDVRYRRPFDPLFALHAALKKRLDAIDRGRHHGAGPITLDRRAAS